MFLVVEVLTHTLMKTSGLQAVLCDHPCWWKKLIQGFWG